MLLYEEIVRISKDPIRYNYELDRFLSRTEFLPKALTSTFLDAYGYDGQASVEWLVGKLRILKGRIESGDVIKCEGEASFSRESFLAWTKEQFANIDGLI